MANIVCPGCGNTYDYTLQKSCTSCGRCSQCGAKVKPHADPCPSCGEPRNLESLRKIEEALNPAKPENAKWARWFQRQQENERLLERVRWWALAGPLVIAALSSEILLFYVCEAFGWPSNWLVGATILIFWVLFYWLLCLLRLGYFPWMLKALKQEQARDDTRGK